MFFEQFHTSGEHRRRCGDTLTFPGFYSFELSSRWRSVWVGCILAASVGVEPSVASH